MPFTHLKEVMYVFSPTDSFYELFGKVVIGIKDERRACDVETVVRSAVLNGNASGIAIMSLDYCVGTENLDLIKLFINCEGSSLALGIVWGSLQASIKLVESNTARPVALVPTNAVLELPQGALEEPKENPKHSDLTYDAGDLTSLRKMYHNGEIIDRSLPANRQVKKSFAASEAGSVDDERKPASDSLKRWVGQSSGHFIKRDGSDEIFSETASEQGRREQSERNAERNSLSAVREEPVMIPTLVSQSMIASPSNPVPAAAVETPKPVPTSILKDPSLSDKEVQDALKSVRSARFQNI